MYTIKKIIDIVRTSFLLGAGPLDRAKLLFVAFYFPLKRLLRIQREDDFIVILRKFGTTFPAHLTDGSDFGVLTEVFADEQYAIVIPGVPKVIVDLGSNVGFSALYFALKYPGVKVYACEPDPHTFAKLQKNIAAFPSIQAYAMAVGDADEVADFFIHPSSMSSSLIARTVGQKKISVISRTLDTFLREIGVSEIDLLKFDVEGAEFRIFRGFKGLSRISALVGELHLDLIGVNEHVFMDLFCDFKVARKKVRKGRYLLTLIHA